MTNVEQFERCKIQNSYRCERTDDRVEFHATSLFECAFYTLLSHPLNHYEVMPVPEGGISRFGRVLSFHEVKP